MSTAHIQRNIGLLRNLNLVGTIRLDYDVTTLVTSRCIVIRGYVMTVAGQPRITTSH
ncbi:hypothetical protein PCAR4_1360025 [Paraburkholderia caribensis]|nr:hypothetical protein PCAR4_1360025 [Paraburkholderia caribensis]